MSLTARLPQPPKSKLCKARSNSGVSTDEKGVPNPLPFIVRHEAPAGTIDFFPPRSRATYPLVTLSLLFPARSTSSVYSQPRSTATADGVSTIKRRGGATIFAWSPPRSRESRCCFSLLQRILTREFGAISTLPISATSIRAREEESVSRYSPTASLEPEAEVPTFGDPAMVCIGKKVFAVSTVGDVLISSGIGCSAVFVAIAPGCCAVSDEE